MLTSIDLSSTWHITQSTVISSHSLDNFSLKKKSFPLKVLYVAPLKGKWQYSRIKPPRTTITQGYLGFTRTLFPLSELNLTTQVSTQQKGWHSYKDRLCVRKLKPLRRINTGCIIIETIEIKLIADILVDISRQILGIHRRLWLLRKKS